MYKKLFTFIVLVLSSFQILYSQAPTITNLSPTSGAVGTAVTITGTNFSSTIVNNIVWFGGVKAIVTSSTATSLTTTVPVGATHSPIRVLVNGLIAESPKAFNITFAGGDISTTSIAPKVGFATGTTPIATALGDFDGDGKLDIAVTNQSSNTISVFRNISTTGTITTGSFATKVDFATGTNPWEIALGDIDGDGKLDMAVSNLSSTTISVLRNTSTSGTISFETKVDFATGTYPRGIALGDLDGDGKLDIAVTDIGSNTISVLRNISTSGSITTGSFATKVDFATGTYPRGIALGDIDGDGKIDMAVSNRNSNTISVFRNISTSGTITTGSFATKEDFATGTNPWEISIGDLDGDGKIDIAVSNFNSNTVSVFRNTSASGSITSSSFATKVDFATGSGPRRIGLGDIGGDGKLDMAVSNQSSNTISVLRNISTSGSITSSSFATKVDYATGTIPIGVSLGDIDGDGKLDIAVANQNSDTVSVLRNVGIPPPISSPTLVHPLTNAINRPVSDTLKWRRVDLATGYQLQVSILRSFSSNLKDITQTDTTFYFAGLTNATKYYWRVRGKNIGGDGPFAVDSFTTSLTRVAYGLEMPTVFSLSQNYPNPFNPSTTIRFGLPNESFVKLEIYNSLGQLVQTLVNEVMSAHYYEVKWEAGKNPTGLYFYKIIATDINNPNNKLIQTKKMMLVK